MSVLFIFKWFDYCSRKVEASLQLTDFLKRKKVGGFQLDRQLSVSFNSFKMQASEEGEERKTNSNGREVG